jgi:tyrosine-protein kinase Etk/Wzc
MASSGKRVLLIDADLRNGHLHRYFGVGRERGLSRSIIGSMPVEEIIHHDVIENLDFIPTGELPPNRSEFLLHLNFGALLESVSASTTWSCSIRRRSWRLPTRSSSAPTSAPCSSSRAPA